MGTPLDMDRPPSDDEMLAIVAVGAPLPFDVIRNQPLGTFFDSGSQIALPPAPLTAGRFAVMPDAVRGDIEILLGEYAAGQRGRGYTHRLRSEEHTSELHSLMRNSYAVFSLHKKNTA